MISTTLFPSRYVQGYDAFKRLGRRLASRVKLFTMSLHLLHPGRFFLLLKLQMLRL